MKKYALLISVTLLSLGSCKKDSTTKPSSTTTTPTTPTSPYYFKFDLDGTSYNLNANLPQYMFFNVNEAGGYQLASTGFYPSMAIRFSWPAGDTVKESDIMGLKGKTLYYNDTHIHPELEFDKDPSNTWYSTDTPGTSYSINISNVTFLKADTTIGYAVRTYVITGTCTGVLDETSKTSVVSSGQFNFVISRRDY